MREPIVLIGDEMDIAVEHLVRYAPILGWDEMRRAVHGMIDRLNKFREPDPIGTVRADDDGNVAVRMLDATYANDQWFVVRTGPRAHSKECDEYVADWPVVHRGNA